MPGLSGSASQDVVNVHWVLAMTLRVCAGCAGISQSCSHCLLYYKTGKKANRNALLPSLAHLHHTQIASLWNELYLVTWLFPHRTLINYLQTLRRTICTVGKKTRPRELDFWGQILSLPLGQVTECLWTLNTSSVKTGIIEIILIPSGNCEHQMKRCSVICAWLRVRTH